MSIYHFMPLEDNEELQQILRPVSESTSCLIIGENDMLKTSLLFQAASTIASNGDQVIFIHPRRLEKCPYLVLGMTEQTNLDFDCIKMMYIPNPLDLLVYLCGLHTEESLPAAILIDDIQHYVSHLSQDQCKESAVIKLFAILEDTAAFISEKKGELCQYMVSLKKSSYPKNLGKGYFQELWNISPGEIDCDYFLTDDHIPGCRVQFHVNMEEEIVMDKAYRLSSET